MSFSNVDRTIEVKNGFSEIGVKSTDYCRYYVKHPDTFLQRKECWTCLFSDFGINTGTPDDTGICKYYVLNICNIKKP